MDLIWLCIQAINKKMSQMISLLWLPFISLYCNDRSNTIQPGTEINTNARINPYAAIQKIPTPAGYQRTTVDSGSFTYYLRNIGLKADQTVYLYNGLQKNNQTAQFALLNISTGKMNLQQCADAVMRIRAEYLFKQKQYTQIVFFDNNKTAYTFSSPYTRDNFDKYLNRVFGMCGSASLAKQLQTVYDFSAIQPGDVIIRGGFPGHAVMVMDVIVNAAGKKVYLLAQSYMPAQDIHILVNPMNINLSPWYEVNNNEIIQTPEYTFTKHELKRW